MKRKHNKAICTRRKQAVPYYKKVQQPCVHVCMCVCVKEGDTTRPTIWLSVVVTVVSLAVGVVVTVVVAEMVIGVMVVVAGAVLVML